MAGALARLRKEFKTLVGEPNKPGLEGVSVALVGDDAFKWQATLDGKLIGEPYADGVFYMSLEFPKNYPFSPPKSKLETKIYHMDINDKGEQCYTFDHDNWTPAMTMVQFFGHWINHLKNPSTETPMNSEIAELYKTDRKKHDETAKAWTLKYAT